jgi:hypothetical protein
MFRKNANTVVNLSKFAMPRLKKYLRFTIKIDSEIISDIIRYMPKRYRNVYKTDKNIYEVVHRWR